MQTGPSTNFPCIVPAAGLSSRMDEWKPLLRFRDRTIIEQVVAVAASVCAPVVVVAGYRGGELAQLLQRHPLPGDSAERAKNTVHIVYNADYERGMFSSIRAGLGFMAEPSPTFIALADMPWVEAQDFTSLAEALEREQGCDAVRHRYGEAPGHPVLLSARVVEKAREAPPDDSMLNILSSFAVCFQDTDYSRVVDDIDTPSDYSAE